MKKNLWLPILLLIFCFASCKKNDNSSNPTTTITAASLKTGTCFIRFNSDIVFMGKTVHEFKSDSINQTFVQDTIQNGKRKMELGGMNFDALALFKSCILEIDIPAGTTISNTSQTFSITFPTTSGSSTDSAGFSVFGTNGVTYTEGLFIAQSGTITLTKLTATGLEGTFAATAKDMNDTTAARRTMQITNGEVYAHF